MAIKTLYTAVGRFERRTNGCNRSCPIILLGGQEYMVDMQEMVIWSMLNWRILRWDDIAQEYEKLATASGYCTERSWEDCTNRLLTRGLLVSAAVKQNTMLCMTCLVRSALSQPADRSSSGSPLLSS